VALAEKKFEPFLGLSNEYQGSKDFVQLHASEFVHELPYTPRDQLPESSPPVVPVVLAIAGALFRVAIAD